MGVPKNPKTFAKRGKIREDDASSIIIRELWKRLRESHKLMIVK
jgi:hypothetical protein